MKEASYFIQVPEMSPDGPALIVRTSHHAPDDCMDTLHHSENVYRQSCGQSCRGPATLGSTDTRWRACHRDRRRNSTRVRVLHLGISGWSRVRWVPAAGGDSACKSSIAQGEHAMDRITASTQLALLTF